MRILTFYYTICLLGILSSSFVQSQSIDTLVHLYPLHVGDKWQYDWRVGGTNPSPHMYYETREITHDTIMPNGIKYFAFKSTRFTSPDPDHTRMDTSTGIVHFWGGNDADNILYDFNFSYGARIDTLFGIPVFAVGNGVNGGAHEFAYGFGIVTLYEETDVYTYWARLNYAKINNVEYGILMSVPNSNTQPIQFNLYQNYPNPFNPSTTFSFDVPYLSHVTISVSNLLGQKTAIVTDKDYPIGSYTVTWDGTNLSSGIYFYNMRVDGRLIKTKKLVIVR